MLESEFKALASQGYNRIPMVAECLADLDTPLSIYRKLADCPDSFLLESVVGGERFGRYSFIGLPAKRRIESGSRSETGARETRRLTGPGFFPNKKPLSSDRKRLF